MRNLLGESFKNSRSHSREFSRDHSRSSMKVNKTLNMNIESIIDDDSDENEYTNQQCSEVDKSNQSLLEMQTSDNDKATLNSLRRSRLYA